MSSKFIRTENGKVNDAEGNDLGFLEHAIPSIDWNFSDEELNENSKEMTPNEFSRYLGCFWRSLDHKDEKLDVNLPPKYTVEEIMSNFHEMEEDEFNKYLDEFKRDQRRSSSMNLLEEILGGYASTFNGYDENPFVKRERLSREEVLNLGNGDHADGYDDFEVNPRVLNDFTTDYPMPSKDSFKDEEMEERGSFLQQLEQKERESNWGSSSQDQPSHGAYSRGRRRLHIPGDSVVGTEAWGEWVREKVPNLSKNEQFYAHLRKPEYVLLQEQGADPIDIHKARIRHEIAIRRKALESGVRVAIEDLKDDVKFRVTNKTIEKRKGLNKTLNRNEVKVARKLLIAGTLGYLVYRELKR